MPNNDADRKDESKPPPPGPPEEAATVPGSETALSQSDFFQVSRVSLVYRYLLLLVLTLIGGLLLSLLVPMAISGRDYLIGGLLALWALALLRYWAFLLAMPHRVCLEGNESLVLHSLFRTHKVKCSEVTALRVSPFYQSYLRIVTSGKKTFPMLNHVDGLHDLITRIKRVNPKVETKGC